MNFRCTKTLNYLSLGRGLQTSLHFMQDCIQSITSKYAIKSLKDMTLFTIVSCHTHTHIQWLTKTHKPMQASSADAFVKLLLLGV